MNRYILVARVYRCVCGTPAVFSRGRERKAAGPRTLRVALRYIRQSTFRAVVQRRISALPASSPHDEPLAGWQRQHFDLSSHCKLIDGLSLRSVSVIRVVVQQH